MVYHPIKLVLTSYHILKPSKKRQHFGVMCCVFTYNWGIKQNYIYIGLGHVVKRLNLSPNKW